MQAYWKMVVNEVLMKGLPGARFYYTPFDEVSRGLYEPGVRRRGEGGLHRERWVLKGAESVYFTEREKDCLEEVLRSKTIVKASKNLGISLRTCEYYLGNIRRKLNCKSKQDLLARFASGVRFEAQLLH